MNGRRFTKTFHGTLTDARKELRKLLREGDTGDHIEPSKITVGSWIDTWIAAGAPGRRKKRVGQRTLERYEELLRVHVRPTLGGRPLQKLQATEIDKLYQDLDERLDDDGERAIAPMTLHHVHVVFNSCLATAERKGLIRATPMRRVEQVPSGGESDHGVALDEQDLGTLVSGFRPSATMYAPVAVDAATGARRNELLAFRWTDLDVAQKALRVERALEVTKKFGVRFKPPKTKRGKRAIGLDDATMAVLLREREKHLRLRAGVPEGVEVDLSLVRLPEDALIFPEPGTFNTPRNPRNFSKEFARRAKRLGFGDFTFHHLRGTHTTLLLDRGVPVHVVAERVGDDPAVLLRNYAKRKRHQTANTDFSAQISALAAGFLGK
ncbi:integrase [Bradyrhizobium sp. GM6.1]